MDEITQSILLANEALQRRMPFWTITHVSSPDSGDGTVTSSRRGAIDLTGAGADYNQIGSAITNTSPDTFQNQDQMITLAGPRPISIGLSPWSN